MPLTLSDFKSQVSDEINQGDRLDSLIAGALRRAGQWFERNYTFLYMERFVQINVDVSEDNARFVPWPTPFIKKLNFVRMYSAASSTAVVPTYTYLVPIDPQRVSDVRSDSPSGYWLSGTDDLDVGGYLVLDQIGSDDLVLEAHYARRSEWPTADADRHWLFDHGEDALLAKTMMNMAPSANEPDWLRAYQSMLDMGIKSMIDSDVDMRASGDFGGYKMVYGP